MKRHKTRYTGVFFREHKSRKHNGKPDRYFILRYRFQGKQNEEGLGWASHGWNAQKANIKIGELKKAQIEGNGAVTMAEKRRIERDRKEAEKAKREQEVRESMSFGNIFKNRYFPQAKTEKTFGSYDRERSLFENWINPVIGALPLRDVAPMNLEKIKKNMRDAGRAPRSIQYCLAVIRQVFNWSYRNDLYTGDNPVSKVKIPKVDNKRQRYLKRSEADALLKDLKVRSKQVHDICLLSLHCGLRADEIFKLTWKDVDLDRGTVTCWDTKNVETRFCYFTKEVKEMFAGLKREKNNDLVFPDRTGGKIQQVSKSFNRAVAALGLNDDVIDPRMKVCFHTLRHTFASWHAQEGTNLYTLQRILGHSSFSMVQRYAHLSPNTLKTATKNFQAAINKPYKADVIPIEN